MSRQDTFSSPLRRRESQIMVQYPQVSRIRYIPNDPNRCQNGFPDFGIRHDSPTNDPLSHNDLHRFHSKLTFDANIDVWKDVCGESENKLSRIAKDAYYQMMTEMVHLKMESVDRPFVMTALPVKNVLYLSSEVKGGPLMLDAKDKKNPVYQELLQCQTALNALGRTLKGIRQDHQNAASCGEMFALYAYFTENVDKDKISRLKEQPIATVRHLDTWNTDGNREMDYDRIVRYDPCGTGGIPRAYGCFQATREDFGLKVVTEEFEDIDYTRHKFEISCIVSGERPG
ncbi:hypothetical protein BDV96DRAFT_594735 [Lophiotrema nucula]|uniref:Uncharacterized protein n=1 Tax=Lophiotrema nucula TaxID=690887 RepID=A0A6A5ZQL7_9PLEO|nr:hypothetical protein BDV96DRAFT_594735 [Lophiotrema nucula]